VATEISDLLTAAAVPTVAVVRGVPDDRLDRPTPCAQFDVRHLLKHLFHVVVNFRHLAGREPVDWATTPDHLAGAWRDRFAAETAALITAWSDPAALAGVSPSMHLPQPLLGRMVLLDVVVHGWDLARATSQPYEADAVAVAVLHDLVTTMGDRAREAGVFAEPVPVAGGDDLTRLLARTGRDPSWPAANAPSPQMPRPATR